MPESKQDELCAELKKLLASGELTGKLPAVNALAERLNVNERTLGKVLSRLSREGILEKRRGIGCFVKEGSGRPRRILVRGDSVTTISGSFHNIIFNGLRDTALAAGCEVELRSDYIGRPDEFDGVIFLGVEEDEPYALLRKRKIPFVVIENHPDPDIASVSADFHHSVYGVLRRLLDGGVSRVAYIGMTTSRRLLTDIEKFHSYLEALDDRLHDIDFSLVRHSWPNPDFAYEKFRDILRKNGPPQAVFISTDHIAPGIFQAATEMGYRIPEHIQLLSCDHLEIETPVSVATFEAPKYELGVQSVKTLFSLWADPGMRRMPKYRLPVRFIPGESLPAIKGEPEMPGKH